jgi:predicted nucleic acid-binding protein
VSVITRCELFAGRAVDEKGINAVLAALAEHPVDRSVAERAGRLRRRSGLRIADALIAATAIEHGLTLVTRNEGDFGKVSGLKIRPPT